MRPWINVGSSKLNCPWVIRLLCQYAVVMMTTCLGVLGECADSQRSDRSSSELPVSPTATLVIAEESTRTVAFERRTIGAEPRYRPAITNVQIHDVDKDGIQDIVACDAQTNQVIWYQQSPLGVWHEHVILDDVTAPAHATVVDIDHDEDNDVIVSVMGNLYPDDRVVGRIVLVEQIDGSFHSKTILDDVRRVTDVQPADFDGDGDTDLAVAVFGYARGQVLWLENRGNGRFRDHELYRAAGAIHVPVADFDGDGDIDIATVLSQHDEEIWAFDNDGTAKFRPRRLHFSHNFDIGSAGLVKSDLDGDGDIDLLWPVGDNLEDRRGYPQPYHGCFWLENVGQWNFNVQRIATFPGTYAASAGDVDADGDQDVVLVSLINHWDRANAPSVVWLENDGAQTFRQRTVDNRSISLVTADCGDLNGDGLMDIVAGGMHVYPPFDRLGRITRWLTLSKQRSDPTADTTEDDTNTSHSLSRVNQQSLTLGTAIPTLPNIQNCETIQFLELRRIHDRTTQRVKDRSATAEDWNVLARAFAAFGFAEQGERCFRRATEMKPRSFQTHFDWASSLSRLGQLKKAIDAYHSALELADDAQRIQVWYRVGLCCLRNEDVEEAEKAFRHAEHDAMSSFQLARLLMRTGRAAEAQTHVDQVKRQYPDALETLLLQARLAESLGDYDNALRYHERSERAAAKMPQPALGLNAEELEQKYGLKRLYSDIVRQHKDNQIAEATRSYQQLLDLRWEAQAARNLAQIQLRHTPKESIRVLDDLLARATPFPQDYFIQGEAYRLMDQWAQAYSCWQQAQKMEPTQMVYRRILDYHHREGHAQQQKQNEAKLLTLLGITKYRSNQIADALIHLKAALRMIPNNAQTWFYLGECYRHTNELSKAEEAYQRCLTLNPDHGRSISALVRLAKSP